MGDRRQYGGEGWNRDETRKPLKSLALTVELEFNNERINSRCVG